MGRVDWGKQTLWSSCELGFLGQVAWAQGLVCAECCWNALGLACPVLFCLVWFCDGDEEPGPSAQ